MKLGWVVALVLVLASGCGNGESTTVATKPEKHRLYPWLKGPTREFLIRGGDNAVQIFGREATRAEREEVSHLVHAWMKTRAAQDWVKDCSFFSRRYIHNLVPTDATVVSGGKVKTCPQALAFFKHLASGTYKNNLRGPIVSLRVKGREGYAQYHGTDGHDWVLPVEKENGEWRIAKATPIGRSS